MALLPRRKEVYRYISVAFLCNHESKGYLLALVPSFLAIPNLAVPTLVYVYT